MTNIHLLYNNADPVKDGYDSDDGTLAPPPSPTHSTATAVGGASELTMCLLFLPPPPPPPPPEPETLLGLHVRLRFVVQNEHRSFDGVVRAYDPEDGTHLVHYPSQNTTQWYNLSNCHFQVRCGVSYM